MGWSFRKSVNCGPFRINIGRSGVGYSLGGKGFRTGVSSRGRRYTSLSLPGTGWRHTSSARASKGCVALMLAAAGGLSMLLAALYLAW